MVSSANNHDNLIGGIRDSAVVEAEKLLESAEKLAAQRRKSAATQAERIISEAKKTLFEQTAAIKKDHEIRLRGEKRRLELKNRENTYRQVLLAVERKISEAVDSPEYRQAVFKWTLEAMIGLGAKKVMVNAGDKERAMMDEVFLRKVAGEYQAATGQSVKPSISESPPLVEQGVTVTSADGRTAFDNRISTRLRRAAPEIRKIVFKEFFGE